MNKTKQKIIIKESFSQTHIVKPLNKVILKNQRNNSFYKFKIENNDFNPTKFSKTFGMNNQLLPIRSRSRQNTINKRIVITSPNTKNETMYVNSIKMKKAKLNPIKTKLITKNFQIKDTEDMKEIRKFDQEIKQMNQGAIININHNINHNIQINVSDKKLIDDDSVFQSKTSNNIDDEVISFTISDDSSDKNSTSKINKNQFKKFCMEIERKLNLKTKV